MFLIYNVFNFIYRINKACISPGPAIFTQNFTISSELTSLSERLSCLWTSTRDKNVRKHAMLSYHRYGLQFENKNRNLHLLLCILLAGDIATNPGPNPTQPNLKTNSHLKCLLTNARSLKSQHKQGNEIINNVNCFQDLVYSEDSDVVCVSETWLNSDISNSEILDDIKYSVKTERAELVVYLCLLKVNRLKVFVKLKLMGISKL